MTLSPGGHRLGSIRRSAVAAVACVVCLFVHGTTFAQTSDVDGRDADSAPETTTSGHHRIPAEESRLSTGVFRDGLKRRGLTEVLELHLKDFPTDNPIDVLLMARDVKVAEFTAAGKTADEKRAAVAEANRILQQILIDFPDDPRHLEWQYTLLNSLLYDEASPFVTRILAGLGGESARGDLVAIADKALAAARSFSRTIADEYARIDSLPTDKFDALERTGYLERLDKFAPAADYLLVWSLFYDVLGRRPDDPEIAGRLNEILLTFAAKPAMLESPHARSHFQVQSLLLAGMTNRRLNDHAKARTFLDRARSEAAAVADARERDRLQWAVTLIEIESIANDRDDGRFEDAQSRLTRLRESPAAKEKSGFSLHLATAMLQRSIHLARAVAAENASRAEQAARFRDDAVHDLSALLAAEPDGREELLGVLDRATPSNADVDGLDPIERCARMWGLIRQADQATGSDAAARLDQVIAIGEKLVALSTPSAAEIIPEAIFQLGTAYYKRNDFPAAARWFLALAVDHPQSDRASRAAALATQLSFEALSKTPKEGDLIALHTNALRVLISIDSKSEAAKYWRFRFAQMLDESGDWAGAAAIYADVPEDHPQHMEAMFRRVSSLAHMVRRAAAASSDSDTSVSAPPAMDAQVSLLHQAFETLDAATRTQLQASPDDARRSALLHLLAEARLNVAEVEALPALASPGDALQRLDGFERTFPAEKSLLARVWQARFRAHQQLDRNAEAETALSELAQADPAGSGGMMQFLYTELSAEGDRLRRAGKNEVAARRFAGAVLIADALVEWAKANPSLARPETIQALQVQLAEACLSAGRLERARDLFEHALPSHLGDAGAFENAEPRVLMGFAEAHFQLGNYARALPAFNRLAMRLPPDDALRWRALLRDLQCRTHLGEPPGGILKVIDQQRRLHPDLGGPDLAPQFESLARENESRQSPKP